MGIQTGGLLLLCMITAVVDRGWAVSAFMGGLIALIPASYFAARAFRFRGARQSQQIVREFNRGEGGKFVLTLVGFGLVFAGYPSVNPVALFGTYCLMLVVQLLVTARIVAR